MYWGRFRSVVSSKNTKGGTFGVSRSVLHPSSLYQSPHRFYATKSDKNEAKNFSNIPVIDVKPFFERSDYSIIRQVDDACRNVGFFYIKGHGVPQELCHKVIDLAEGFFAQPVEEKEKISILNSKCYRGYQVVGQNITGGKRDWHEAIDLYSEEGIPEDYRHDLAKPIHGRNLWPQYPPEFRETFDLYVAELRKLGTKLMHIMALALGKERHFFEPFTNNSYWVMRIISYPPIPQEFKSEDTSTGVGAHTDYGCLTMVNQTKALYGLEVQNVKGDWIIAEPIPETFVINIGDMLSHWTGGQYKSTLHRVRSNNSPTPRTSIPFFFEPNYDAFIKPILAHTEKELKFPRDGIYFGEHLKNKVTTNFDFKKYD